MEDEKLIDMNNLFVMWYLKYIKLWEINAEEFKQDIEKEGERDLNELSEMYSKSFTSSRLVDSL